MPIVFVRDGVLQIQGAPLIEFTETINPGTNVLFTKLDVFSPTEAILIMLNTSGALYGYGLSIGSGGITVGPQTLIRSGLYADNLNARIGIGTVDSSPNHFMIGYGMTADSNAVSRGTLTGTTISDVSHTTINSTSGFQEKGMTVIGGGNTDEAAFLYSDDDGAGDSYLSWRVIDYALSTIDSATLAHDWGATDWVQQGSRDIYEPGFGGAALIQIAGQGATTSNFHTFEMNGASSGFTVAPGSAAITGTRNRRCGRSFAALPGNIAAMMMVEDSGTDNYRLLDVRSTNTTPAFNTTASASALIAPVTTYQNNNAPTLIPVDSTRVGIFGYNAANDDILYQVATRNGVDDWTITSTTALDTSMSWIGQNSMNGIDGMRLEDGKILLAYVDGGDVVVNVMNL